MDKEERLKIALFRYQIIAPVLDPDLKRGEKVWLLRKAAERIYDHPTLGKKKYKYEAILKWYKRYRREGLDAIFPKERLDKGKSKAIPDEIAQKVCDLKIEVPSRSVSTIIDILERNKDVPLGLIKSSTLARVLASKGLSGHLLREKTAFRRYQAELPNDTWQSDQYAGPYIPSPKVPNKKIQTQLFAFLDDHSRLLCHGQFYLDGSLLSLEDCFRKAILRRGLPKRVYFDCGKVYSSNHMKSICAYLGIQPIHAEPYSPEGKGKMEKFLGYVDSCFIPELKKHPAQSLEQLNDLFFAWSERRYNHKLHSELKRTPLDVWMDHIDRIRFASDEDVKRAFLFKEERIVSKARTIKALGKYWEVLPILVNKKVEIRYDPQDTSHILVFYQGQFFQKAYPLELKSHVGKKGELKENEEIKACPESRRDTGIDYLSQILKDHKKALKEELPGLSLATRPSDNRFTLSDLLSILEKKELGLKPYEKEQIHHYFNTYGPFDKELAQRAIELAIEVKGKNQHITFYLDRIVQIHKGR